MTMQLIMNGAGIFLGLGTVAASATLNYYGVLTGMSGNLGIAMGGLMAALDGLKILIATKMRWETVAGQRDGTGFQRTAGYLTCLMLSCLSIVLGFAALNSNLGQNVAHRDAAKTLHADLGKERKELTTELALARATLVRENVQAKIKGLETQYLYRRSKRCNDVNRPDSSTFCGKYFVVKGQLQNSIPAKEKNARIVEIQSRIKAKDAKIQAIDLVAVHDTSKKGLNALDKWVLLGAYAALALVLEMISTILLPWFVADYATRKQPETVDPVQPVQVYETPLQPRTIVPEVGGSVQRWVGTYLKPARGSVVPATEALAAYNNWARASGEPILNRTAFGTEIARMSIAKGKYGKNRLMHYFDVRFVGATVQTPRLELVKNG